MKTLLSKTIKHLKKSGVDYADLRYITSTHEAILVENNQVKSISFDVDEGVGVRVFSKGSWGFACTPKLTWDQIKSTADVALAIARSCSSINKKKYKFPSGSPIKANFKSPFEIDPFTIPLEKKLDYLLWASQELKSHPNIKTAISGFDFFKTNKLFFNTEGSEISQKILESGGHIEAIATGAGDVQKRSYPSSHHCELAQAGYEYVKALDLVGGARKIRKEAVSLLRAKECPNKKTTLILDGSQMALQIHESCGHPAELDRLLGREISLAGDSFLTLEKLNKFKYGSKLVNIYSDPTIEGGAGSFGYDDEGTPAKKAYLVKDGIFTGYLTSKETAAHFDIENTGCMRASGWNRTPLIRMTNINIEPQDATLEELIKEVRNGVFMSTNKSWSIDEKRLNFQFSTEIAWEIKNGELTQVLKNPLYASTTPIFWNSCSGISNKDHWRMWSVSDCGKGEPMQTMHVGHGTAPARFENIQVRSAAK